MLRTMILGSTTWLLILLAIFQWPHFDDWTFATLRLVFLFWFTPTVLASVMAWALHRA
ncbi:MAG: hypothetical protein HY749_24810 [Gammaproteobacteria bacterium]|nr:hypothetical protein [Gammaproteobacteria bacterium]MBI5615472.1 hypothetical protein [Gammaproteobacteria bacterium]